jgi:hypothetical protein
MESHRDRLIRSFEEGIVEVYGRDTIREDIRNALKDMLYTDYFELTINKCDVWYVFYLFGELKKVGVVRSCTLSFSPMGMSMVEVNVWYGDNVSEFDIDMAMGALE